MEKFSQKETKKALINIIKNSKIEDVHNYVEDSDYKVTFSENSQRIEWIITWEHPNLQKLEELLQ